MSSIDVIVPNYNYGRFLEQCVESVLAQRIDGLNVVIVDNASTDGSPAIARQLVAADPRVRLVEHERNLGPQASFNHGINLARGDYMMILCSDDALRPGVLAQAIRFLDRHPEVNVIMAGRAEQWQDGAPVPTEEPSCDYTVTTGDALIAEICATLGEDCSVGEIIVRTSVQKEVGHYRAGLDYWDDLEMILRLARKGAVARSRGSLILHRVHAANRSTPLWNDRLADLRECEKAFNSFFDHEGSECPEAARLRKLTRRCVAERAYWSAASRLLSRERGAAQLFLYAFQLNRSVLLAPPLGHLLHRRGALGRVVGAFARALRRRYDATVHRYP